MPKLDVNPEGAVSGTAIAVVIEPILEVAPSPDSSTAYCTPQPELPHSCQPQPSSLKASRAPIADVKPVGAVSEMSTES